MTLPPTKPEVTFEVCDENVCLTEENARRLALWLLQMERWAAETTRLCAGDK